MEACVRRIDAADGSRAADRTNVTAAWHLMNISAQCYAHSIPRQILHRLGSFSKSQEQTWRRLPEAIFAF
jgi:hypothetical protein